MSMRSVWNLAAELFAASFLEICPDVIFSDIWVGRRGFYVEYTLAFPVEDEILRRIEERMKEKIRDKVFCGVFAMSAKNIIEYLKQIKQYRLAREIDRSQPELPVLKIGEYLGVLEEEIEPDLSKVKAIFLERREGLIYGAAFETKEELKEFRKIKEPSFEGVLEIVGEDLYWLPEGVAFRKRLEGRIEKFLQDQGFKEVEFSGNIDWYGEKKVFTTLEEELPSRFECGLLDYPLQKIFYIANSPLQMFNDFGKIVPLIFEPVEGGLVCNDWVVISEEGSGIKIWIDRLAAMLVEKRDFLVC